MRIPSQIAGAARRLRATRGAFSLLEILAALAVLMILSVLLVSVSGHVANLWSANESKSQMREKARTALEFIERDLRQVVLPLDPAQADGPYLAVNPAGSESVARRDALFLTAPLDTSSDKGDLAAVGYWVDRYNLCRSFVECQDGKPPEVSAMLAAAPADAENDYQGLLLEGVAGCWIKTYAAPDTQTPVDEWDTRSQHELPARIEVSLLVLDKSLTGKVKSGELTMPDPADWSDAAAYLEDLPLPIGRHATTVWFSLNLGNRQ